MRELGYSLEVFTPGQLQEAIQACAYDGKLIDDPDGVHFSDRLVKDHREAYEELYDNDTDVLVYRSRGGKVQHPVPFPHEEQQSWVHRVAASASASTSQSFVERVQEEAAQPLTHTTTQT